MNALARFRSTVLLVPLTAPLLVALAGCGGSETLGPVPESEALKKSVSSYEAEIEKDKAKFKAEHGKTGK